MSGQPVRAAELLRLDWKDAEESSTCAALIGGRGAEALQASAEGADDVGIVQISDVKDQAVLGILP